MSELLEWVGNPHRFLHQIKANSNQTLKRTSDVAAIFGAKITSEKNLKGKVSSEPTEKCEDIWVVVANSRWWANRRALKKKYHQASNAMLHADKTSFLNNHRPQRRKIGKAFMLDMKSLLLREIQHFYFKPCWSKYGMKEDKWPKEWCQWVRKMYSKVEDLSLFLFL